MAKFKNKTWSLPTPAPYLPSGSLYSLPSPPRALPGLGTKWPHGCPTWWTLSCPCGMDLTFTLLMGYSFLKLLPRSSLSGSPGDSAVWAVLSQISLGRSIPRPPHLLSLHPKLVIRAAAFYSHSCVDFPSQTSPLTYRFACPHLPLPR